jgi:hypothetical protein
MNVNNCSNEKAPTTKRAWGQGECNKAPGTMASLCEDNATAFRRLSNRLRAESSLIYVNSRFDSLWFGQRKHGYTV